MKIEPLTRDKKNALRIWADGPYLFASGRLVVASLIFKRIAPNGSSNTQKFLFFPGSFEISGQIEGQAVSGMISRRRQILFGGILHSGFISVLSDRADRRRIAVSVPTSSRVQFLGFFEHSPSLKRVMPKEVKI
jgi:hypothetical protein